MRHERTEDKQLTGPHELWCHNRPTFWDDGGLSRRDEEEQPDPAGEPQGQRAELVTKGTTLGQEKPGRMDRWAVLGMKRRTLGQERLGRMGLRTSWQTVLLTDLLTGWRRAQVLEHGERARTQLKWSLSLEKNWDPKVDPQGVLTKITLGQGTQNFLGEPNEDFADQGI
ncbi:unnamed protein product [Linum trigynum]|uniref:Uncharacterized protein n=1 Tax=Linum trigynum TaxID=586398 RepID=A0AAV2F9D9_9ROSI